MKSPKDMTELELNLAVLKNELDDLSEWSVNNDDKYQSEIIKMKASLTCIKEQYEKYYQRRNYRNDNGLFRGRNLTRGKRNTNRKRNRKRNRRTFYK